jgi:S1-C subfamily serine protease
MQESDAQYEARREGRPPLPDLEATTLRAELGDQDYERFLAARGVPTRINIMRVLASSPAQRAGLQQGDEIFAYDGVRVFDIQELNELTVGGTSGESVVVDVRRDGQNLRVVLPRGPIGVLSGGDLRGPSPGLQR